MDLFLFKILSLALIVGVILFGGLSAIYFTRKSSNTRMFSLGNAFSGGIFLGAGFLHLLPEAAHNLEEIEYPLAYLFALLAFILVFYLEKLMLKGGHSHSVNEHQHNPEHIHHPEHIYPYALTFVLCIHSFISGAALGSMQDVLALTALMIAIVAHKWSEAFALVINLFKGGIKYRNIILMLIILSLSTPLGGAAGMILSATLHDSFTAQFFANIFDSMAAGTFIYVAIVDIIGEEFKSKNDISLKFLFLMIGVAAMAGVSMLHAGH